MENLFDTINDPDINDEEFLSGGKKRWNSKKYFTKLTNLAEVISGLGDDGDGPEILGLAEVENSKVLDALLNTEDLSKYKYRYIHYDSPDGRGIDVALVYKEKYLKPLETKIIPIPPSKSKKYRTRDLLYVKGIVGKDTIHVVVTHWPSRIGGKAESEVDRIHVSRTLRSFVDSICFKGADNILIMGDFNDEPSDNSLALLAGTKTNCPMTNPYVDLDRENLGTIKYKNSWDLFDQILLSKGFMNDKGIEYERNSADIYDPLWLHYKEDERNGPFRTFMGSKYYGGYSDHFPVYIVISH